MISTQQYRFSPVYIPASFKRNTNHWYVKSWKAKDNRIADLYSQLEYFNFLLHEINPDVQLLCEQPLHINCKFNGARLNYIFDLWVKWRNGYEELIEVKRKDDLIPSPSGNLEPKNWTLISQWCSENGYNCRFVTDNEIISNRVLLSNSRQLLKYNPDYIDLSLRSELISKITKGVNTSLINLLNLYSHVSEEIFMSTLTYCYINGDLETDLKEFQLSKLTKIIGV